MKPALWEGNTGVDEKTIFSRNLDYEVGFMIKVPCDKWREREKEAKRGRERRRDTVTYIYDFGRIAGDVHSRRRCRCRHRRSVYSGPALDLHQSCSARSDQCTLSWRFARPISHRARCRLLVSSSSLLFFIHVLFIFVLLHTRVLHVFTFFNHFFVYHDKTLLLPLR